MLALSSDYMCIFSYISETYFINEFMCICKFIEKGLYKYIYSVGIWNDSVYIMNDGEVC